MQANIDEDRKKKTFAVLYFVSVILTCYQFLSCWFHGAILYNDQSWFDKLCLSVLPFFSLSIYRITRDPKLSSCVSCGVLALVLFGLIDSSFSYLHFALMVSVFIQTFQYIFGLFGVISGALFQLCSLLILIEIRPSRYFTGSSRELDNDDVFLLRMQLMVFIIWYLITLISYQFQIREMKRELASLTRFKGDFLAKMSHELRTPLFGIIGSLEMIGYDCLPSYQYNLIEIAKSCCSRLSQTITEVLDISNIGAVIPSESVRINIDALLNEVTHSISSRALSCAKVTYTIEDKVPRDFMSAPDRIKQLLINLIHSSMRRARCNGTIVIHVDFTPSLPPGFADLEPKYLPNPNGYIRFKFIDEGAVLNEKDLDKLSKPLGDDNDLQKKLLQSLLRGSDVRYDLNKYILKQLRGLLRVCKSEENRGVMFEFVIPYEKIDRRLDQALHQKQHKKKKNKGTHGIMVVEDNKVNQTILGKMISKYDSAKKIVYASNGEEALKQLEKKQFEIILLDIEMPVLDGLSTVREIRKLGIQTPVIGISAHSLPSHHKLAMDSGMDGFMSKPVLYESLSNLFMEYNV